MCLDAVVQFQEVCTFVLCFLRKYFDFRILAICRLPPKFTVLHSVSVK